MEIESMIEDISLEELYSDKTKPIDEDDNFKREEA